MDMQEYNDAVAYLLSDDGTRVWPQHIQCTVDVKEKKNAKRNYCKAMEKMTLVNGVLHKKCRRTKASNEEPLRVVKSDVKQVGLPDGHNLMHTKWTEAFTISHYLSVLLIKSYLCQYNVMV